MIVELNVSGCRVALYCPVEQRKVQTKRILCNGAMEVHWHDTGSRADGDGQLKNLEWLSQLDAVVALRDQCSGELEQACRQVAKPLLLVSALPLRGKIGEVLLVGGGPGIEELLSWAALEALSMADVVLYDSLAPHGSLDRLAPGAQLINVGKTPGHHPVSQRRIEELLVHFAHAGKTVVRLKGGDPFVFGRGSEELAACRAAGVPSRIIPGISSAISVPGSVGIPMTHRNLSHSFTVLSGHAPLAEAELARLAETVNSGGTLVVLMGVLNLAQITAGLLRHAAQRELPAAVVERGFSSDQRVIAATLDTLAVATAKNSVRGPAVLVIGEVVALGEGALAALHRVHPRLEAVEAL